MSFLNNFSVSPGSNATQRVGYQSLIKGRFFQPRLNPLSVTFSRRSMAQIFCDSSFHKAALSMPTKTGQSGDNNPGHPSDAQRKQQIEDCFGQMTTLPDPRHKAKVEPHPNSG
jgi:hypothetical protein